MTQAITPQQFVAKWSTIQQKETAVSQSHFNDICALVGHAPPIAYDPTGKNFSFEAQTSKPGRPKRVRRRLLPRPLHLGIQRAAQRSRPRLPPAPALPRSARQPPPPPKDVADIAYQRLLKSRTLTNLYNVLVYFRENKALGQLWDSTEFAKVTRKSVTRAQIQELDDIHRALDTAVLDAYRWPHDLNDEQILERLLALNLERAAAQ